MDLAHWLVPKRSGDQYLVSYPRSGNTWLRTMLVNVAVPDAHSNLDTILAVLPDVSLHGLSQVWRLTDPRILKTHSWYRPQIKRAVYLVRDGRDAVISYYHFLITRRGRSGEVPFSEFFEDYCEGRYGQRWHENVVSWLTCGRHALGEGLLVVRFEDMKADTVGVLGKVVDFLGVQGDIARLQRSVEDSRIENARQIEKSREAERDRPRDLSNPNVSFYRSGKTNQWREVFTEQQAEKFNHLSREGLELGGYWR
jgi:estrone sulfotransferase